MITGELKNKVDSIWDTLWTGGITSPITVLEQITYLMFMKLIDDKRSEIADNDIPDIIERFSNLDRETDRERTEQSFFVDKQEIVDNDYDLSINKYKKIEYVPVEYPPTKEILTNLRKLEMEIGTMMDELGEMLNG